MLLKKNKNTPLSNQALLVYGRQQLATAVPEASLETELLLAQALNKDRVFVLAHPQAIPSTLELKTFLKLLKKRLAGWPNAYLLGHKEFYGYDFKVNPSVLIPRPESEIMIETLLKVLTKSTGRKMVIDIGTGSGALIGALAREFTGTASYYASDRSLAALAMARLNLKRLAPTVKLLAGDLFRPYPTILNQTKPKLLVIAANLPYLTPAQLQEPSLKKEPRAALVSGQDGLNHYRRLFKQLNDFYLEKTTDWPLTTIIMCEINPEQAADIKKLALASFPNLLLKLSFINDLSRRIRFLNLEIKSTTLN
jgi:release factor glutamine methyltransferase